MYEWKLNNVFKSVDEWKLAFNEAKQESNRVKEFKNTLNNKEGLEAFFSYQNKLSKKLEVLYGFVALNRDRNTKELTYNSLLSEFMNLLNDFEAKSSFVNSELIKTPYETYLEFAKSSEIIKNNLFSVKKLFDLREHILPEEQEKIIADYNSTANGYADLYDSLMYQDYVIIPVTLTDGTTVEVSPNTYSSFLGRLEKQEDRKRVFEALFGYYDKHKNTLANIYNGVVNADLAYMKAKGYKNPVEAMLDNKKIPLEVYTSLINTGRENTAPLKRFIQIRKKYFGLEEYHTYDRILTIAGEGSVKYTYDEAYKQVLEALKPMGDDFVKHAKETLEEGRVDVYPRDGKQGGAYSTQIYGYGTYILLNHTDDLESAFTLAHECGHSIHTLYSNENQPYETKDYELFVAEIPSTFNEHLFLDHILHTSKDKNVKLQAVEKQIMNIVSTFYRQTLFADFEYQAHMKALNGEALTYEVLDNIMTDLYQTYYGIDLNTEPLKKMVWAYIPHMYGTPFYIYQYATCFSASSKIFNDIKNNVPGAFDNYINMLKSGGKDYPVNLVKNGGADLTTPAPFKAVCDSLNSLLDELEELIK